VSGFSFALVLVIISPQVENTRSQNTDDTFGKYPGPIEWNRVPAFAIKPGGYPVNSLIDTIVNTIECEYETIIAYWKHFYVFSQLGRVSSTAPKSKVVLMRQNRFSI